IITAPGNNDIPDFIAEKPNISCINIGIMTAAPIIAIKETIPSAVVIVNILFLNTRNSKIGFSNFNWRRINHINVNVPIIIDTYTWGLVQLWLPAVLNPYNKPPNPNVDNI